MSELKGQQERNQHFKARKLDPAGETIQPAESRKSRTRVSSTKLPTQPAVSPVKLWTCSNTEFQKLKISSLNSSFTINKCRGIVQGSRVRADSNDRAREREKDMAKAAMKSKAKKKPAKKAAAKKRATKRR